MPELTLTDRVIVPDGVMAREIDGETVILNLDTGTYFGLDAVGTEIWRAIKTHGLLQEVFASLELEYDVDAATLRADLLQLVNQMCEKGLLQTA